MLSVCNPLDLLPCYKFRLAIAYEHIAHIYRDAGWDTAAHVAEMQAGWFRKQADEPLSPNAVEKI